MVINPVVARHHQSKDRDLTTEITESTEKEKTE